MIYGNNAEDNHFGRMLDDYLNQEENEMCECGLWVNFHRGIVMGGHRPYKEDYKNISFNDYFKLTAKGISPHVEIPVEDYINAENICPECGLKYDEHFIDSLEEFKKRTK